jgi:tetratricopeptide (TPR) repeat protein
LIAEKGILVSKELIARAPKLVHAHYYLGMNYGQLARTRTLGALQLVNQMEEVFQTARPLDEYFDYAGSDRNLGLLYLEAPSVISIGSRTKARQHLRRAVELAPEYPENHLNLLEAYLRWKDHTSATRELKAITGIWPKAQEQFKGELWEASWVDWNKRLQTARKRIEGATKALESPRSGN